MKNDKYANMRFNKIILLQFYNSNINILLILIDKCLKNDNICDMITIIFRNFNHKWGSINLNYHTYYHKSKKNHKIHN